MVNNKGITPVIAIVLLMMMTVAAAGAAYFWITGVQSTIQADTSAFISDTLERQDFEIQNVDCDATENNISTLIYNSGKSDFSSVETWIFLLNSTDGTTINSSQGQDTTLARTRTKLIWPTQSAGIAVTAGIDYTIKITVGGINKEASCKGAA